MDRVATLIRSGKINEAQTELSKHQANAGADWHWAHGLLLRSQGEIDDAMKAFEKALELEAEHSDAMFHLAFCHDLYGDEDQALELYETLASMDPAPVNALLNLAVIYEDQGNFDDSEACIHRVLTRYPEHPRARLFLKDIESSSSMFYDENQERNREKRNAVLDTPITDFELSVRSRNCLKKMNINSLGDLLRISEIELLAYKNFGETSLNEIRAMLRQKGLRLGQLKEEEPPPPSRPASPRRPDGPPDLLNRYLSEIELSGRSRKCLQRLNLLTVSDLINKSEAELLATKNFGQTSLSEIKLKLGEFGLTLRKKPE